MRADLLHVFGVRFNPIRWKQPHKHFLAWVDYMLDECGVHLHIGECQLGERPFECNVRPDHPRFHFYGFRSSTPAWTKENLLNLCIARAPEARYIAWCDTDVFFEKTDWAAECVHALQMYHWIQPWTQCIDRGPNNEILNDKGLFVSFCWRYEQDGPASLIPDRHGWRAYHHRYPHPGFCVPANEIVYPLGEIYGTSSRWYDGEVYVIRTASGNEMSITPNHPILTDRGWRSASALNIGDNLFSARSGHRITIEGDKQHVPAAIEEIVRSFNETRGSHATTTPIRAEDFHGDGRGSKVAIIGSNRLLGGALETELFEEVHKEDLRFALMQAEHLLGNRSGALLLESLGLSASTIDRIAHHRDALPLLEGSFAQHPLADSAANLVTFLRTVGGPSEKVPFGIFADDALGPEVVPYGIHMHADNPRNLLRGMAGQVELDPVVYIGTRSFSGHVYNLSSKRGAIIVNNLVTHNCWATRRDILEITGGLFDLAAMGAGDHSMALALVGKANRAAPPNINRNYVDHLLRWQAKVQYAVHGRIGFCHNVINHRFHGAKRDRNYLPRWEKFVRHGFNPDTDLKRNSFQVIEWSGTQPELEREWINYLRERQEDSNIAGAGSI